MRPDALIVITCPNDHCSLAPWQSNPYHLAQYTFEEFKQLTTGQLGEARQWLLGTSVNGTAALEVSTNELQPATEMRELMRAAVLVDAALLPPQANIAPTPEDCLYFTGVWGGTVPANAAISPASHSSFIEPWRKIDLLERERAESSAVLAGLREQLAQVQETLELERQERQSDLRRAQARARAVFTEQRQTAQAINSLTLKAEAYAREKLLRREIQHLNAQVAGLQAALDHERLQLAHYRGVTPTYRWLLGHLRRRALGSPLPILPPDVSPPNLEVHTLQPADEERLLIEASGLFDPAWYVARYPDIVGIDALEHYRNCGWRERRRASPAFDTVWYLSHNPDVAELGINPLVHYIRHGIAQGRLPAPRPSAVSAAEQTIRDVSAFEPEIANVADFKDVSRLTFRSAVYPSALLKAWGKLFASLTSQFSHVIFLPWLVRGGADLIAMNAVRAAIEQHGPAATLVIVTDHDRVEAADWLPLAAEIRVISDYSPNLSHEDRVRIVEMLIVSLRPRAVLNVNSRACWDAIERKGLALAQFTRLYGALFCRDYTEDSRAAGYSDTHFRPSLPYYTKIYFDNQAFRQELIQNYGLPVSIQGRLSVVYAPSAEGLRFRGFRRGDAGGRLSVLWAGRFCRQKNIDLLIEIAQSAPHVQFDVYGGGDAAYTTRLTQAEQRLPNISLKGFPSLENIPTERYGAFLFTSLWEGLPTVLINIGALGLPIVASDVGGVSELVNSETGWLIQNYTRPEPYLAALDEIQRVPDEAALRADKMAAWLEERHSWKAYIQAFSSSPSFLD